MNKNRILLVDDEPSVLSSLCRALHNEPWEITTELSGEQALLRMAEKPIKVVISDEKMARMQGSEFLALAKDLSPRTIRIILTGHASMEAAQNAINIGEVFRFLTKPWDSEQLKEVIREALRKYDREQVVINALIILKNNPHLLPDVEKKCPGFSQSVPHEHGVLLLSALSDDALEAILLLLGKIDN